MTKEAKKYLSDILLAVETIEQFLVGFTDFDAYQNDLKTKSAVERQLAIIGEDVSKFKKVSTISLTQSERIVAVRNRLIHAYDAVDDTIVWVILMKHLPVLKTEVEKIMRE